MSDCTTQSVLFPGIFAKPVVVKLDHEHSSSDGGALLLKAVDERLGLTERLAACVDDPRQAGKVRHAMLDLLRQRIYAIACGYPDGNDAARLAQDPIHKLLLERDPITGERLASQPTLSRFENRPRRADLYRMTDALADTVIGHHRQRLRGKVARITVDMDPTDDPTHGQQEFAFYNAHYGNWCYLPVVVKLTFGEEAEQHVVGVVLRPGNAPATYPFDELRSDLRAGAEYNLGHAIEGDTRGVARAGSRLASERVVGGTVRAASEGSSRDADVVALEADLGGRETAQALPAAEADGGADRFRRDRLAGGFARERR
jgi:hypothetical protein